MQINKKTLKVVAVFLLIPFAVKPSSADSTKKKVDYYFRNICLTLIERKSNQQLHSNDFT